MALDKKYPTKKSIGDGVQKGATQYFDETEKIQKQMAEDKLKYEKASAKRAEAMRYLRKLGGK
jgi:uncharacterized lipoprotein YehR (DUF1307 family)